MHRSSESIGTIAAALAKAQTELTNPEKSLIGAIGSPFRDEQRTFRYAPLSSGLDIVRKSLGRHEIATVQTTALNRETGLIHLTTMLAHSSGEWLSSEWPVCPISETAAPQRMGAALTYARRYALFTLVGIAGEDDVDAPDLPAPRPPMADSRRSDGNGARKLSRQPQAENIKSSATPALDLPPHESAALVQRLLRDVQGLKSPDAALAWACQAIGAKNSLTSVDARVLDDAFRAKLADLEVLSPEDIAESSGMIGKQHAATGGLIAEASNSTRIDKGALSFPEPRRLRDRQHVKYVARRPCLICGRQPSDPHHLRFAQPPALGRKVSDEFTVPLCRGHHREVHRSSDEIAWWIQAGIDALAAAQKLWRETHPVRAVPASEIRSETAAPHSKQNSA
jgi:hypothetical protein